MQLEVAAALMPAGDEPAGGDFWSRVDRPDGDTFIVVGDVQGHGGPAARLAEEVRRDFEVAAETAARPCELLETVNTAVRSSQHDAFVTAVAVKFEPAGRRLR